MRFVHTLYALGRITDYELDVIGYTPSSDILEASRNLGLPILHFHVTSIYSIHICWTCVLHHTFASLKQALFS